MLKYKSKKIDTGSYSGADEVYIAYFMSLYSKGPKLKWKNLSQCYQHIHWYATKCCPKKAIPCSRIKVLHHFGDIKPWISHIGLYDDIDSWIYMYREMLKNTNINFNNLKDLVRYANINDIKKINNNKYIRYIQSK